MEVQTPVDHIKIILQIQKGRNQKYHGSIDAGRSIFRQFGLQGIYLGFNVTLLREVLAMGIYFSFYEYMMRVWASKWGSEDVPILSSFMCGGISGSLSWLVTYPIDYTKTIIQSDNL